MKRPVCVFGFGYLFTLLVSSFFNASLSLIIFVSLALTLVIMFIILDIKKNLKFIIVIVGITSAFGFYTLYTNAVYNKIIELDGKTSKIEATVLDKIQRSDKSFYYLINATYIDIKNSFKNVKLLFYPDDNYEFDYYDKITAEIEFVNYNKNKLVINDYNRSKGIYLSANQADSSTIVVDTSNDKPFYYNILRFRDSMKSNIDKTIKNKNSASIVKSMIFGGSKDLLDSTYNNFKKSGVLHLFAVSGLHLSILILVFSKLLRLFKINIRLVNILCCVLVLFFMAISGFSYSILRSGIMTIVFLVSRIFGEKSDSLNSLAISGIIITAFNPYAVASVGFILTFSATLGVIFYYSKVYKFINRKIYISNKILRNALNIFFLSLVVSLFILPCNIIFFKAVSLLSPLLNILFIPIAYLILPLGAFIALFGNLTFLSGIVSLIGIFTSYISGFISDVSEFLSRLPFIYLPLGFDFVYIWFVCSIVLFGLSYFSRLKVKMMMTSTIMSIILIFTGFVSHSIFNKDVLKVAVINEGYGKSIVFTYNNLAFVVGMGGNEYISTSVSNYLESIGHFDIDLLVLPKLNNTISKAAPLLLNNYNVKALMMPENGELYTKIHNLVNSNTIILKLDNLEMKLDDNILVFVENFDNPVVSVKFNNVLFKIGWNTKYMLQSEYMGDLNLSFVLDRSFNLISDLNTDLTVLCNNPGELFFYSNNVINAYDKNNTIISVSSNGKLNVEK